MFGAREVLIMIDTYGTEDEKKIMDDIGNHRMVDFVSPCSDGRYLARASCKLLDDYSQLQQQFSGMNHIKSVEIFLIKQRAELQVGFSRLQKQVLKHLLNKCSSNGLIVMSPMKDWAQ